MMLHDEWDPWQLAACLLAECYRRYGGAYVQGFPWHGVLRSQEGPCHWPFQGTACTAVIFCSFTWAVCLPYIDVTVSSPAWAHTLAAVGCYWGGDGFTFYPDKQLTTARQHVCCMLQGFCYVYYSHADAAAAAMDHLNGMEFPPNSGHRLKVGFTHSHISVPPTPHVGVTWRCTKLYLWLLKCCQLPLSSMPTTPYLLS